MASSDPVEITADRVERISCRKCGRHLDVSAVQPFSRVECPDCKTAQVVPMRLGPFLLLELLGAGGMGAVYRALDQSLGRYVAIKVMRRALGEDPQFVESFLREARAAAAINHRNVVQIYSCGQEKGQPYIVMELVAGGRLDQLLAKGEPLGEVRALEIGMNIAEGLKAANDIGLIHGDIKPANILFDKDGVAKVVDFGLARFMTRQSDAGEVWGTPYYIAPEKAQGHKVDHRSDIYSLGATLYHALGAKPPFEGDTATDVVVARLKSPALGLRAIRPLLQPETADVVARMLEADPFKRYPTHASLLADLREALRIARQAGASLPRRLQRQPKRRALAAACAVLLLAGLAALAFRLITSRRPAVAPAEGPAAAPASAAETAKIEPVVEESKPGHAAEEPTPDRPFTAEELDAIRFAMGQLEQGTAGRARGRLEQAWRVAAGDGLARVWLRLFQGIALLADGREAEAARALREAARAKLAVAGATTPPARLPIVASAYLARDADEAALRAETRDGAAWTTNLCDFVVGFRALMDQDLPRAETLLRSYAAAPTGEPGWPYALQRIAKRWADQAARVEQAKQEASKAEVSGQTAEAIAGLEQLRFRLDLVLVRVLDREIQNLRYAQERRQAEQDWEQQVAHQADVQSDLDRVDEVRGGNLPLVARKDFLGAASAAGGAAAGLKTEEGREFARLVKDAYERMAALQRFLVERLGAAPFRGGALRQAFGGDALGADARNIRIALGVHGELLRPWEELSAAQYLLLADHYLADAPPAAERRADLLLAAALYCYENGGLNAAARYAGEACSLNPAVKTAVRRLMPDTLAE